jgi:hypothetical protein
MDPKGFSFVKNKKQSRNSDDGDSDDGSLQGSMSLVKIDMNVHFIRRGVMVPNLHEWLTIIIWQIHPKINLRLLSHLVNICMGRAAIYCVEHMDYSSAHQCKVPTLTFAWKTQFSLATHKNMEEVHCEDAQLPPLRIKNGVSTPWVLENKTALSITNVKTPPMKLQAEGFPLIDPYFCEPVMTPGYAAEIIKDFPQENPKSRWVDLLKWS